MLSEFARRGVVFAFIAAVVAAALLLPYFICGGSGGVTAVREGSFLRVSLLGRTFVLDLDIALEITENVCELARGTLDMLPLGFVFESVTKCY